jgi:membrane associated rhomboid family serine protease
MREYFAEINRFLDRIMTPAVKIIVVVNTLILLYFIVMRTVAGPLFYYPFLALAFSPALALMRGCVWQFLTFNFVHVEFFHCAVNMLGLWFFGRTLEERWGTRRFWNFYLCTGFGAGLFHALIVLGLGYHNGVIIGASGAIYGIFLAFAAYYPTAPVYVFGIYPIQAKHLVFVEVLITFLASTSPGASGGQISHLTHLTGLVAAYIWLSIYHRTVDIRRWRWTRAF